MMKSVKDREFFETIHNFLKVYLPEQRRCSPHTVKSYRIALNQFIDYLVQKRSVSVYDVGFELINYNTVSAFLDYLTGEKKATAKTRNLKLAAISSFLSYASSINYENTLKLIDISNVPRQREESKLTVEYMTEKSIEAILKQPDTTTKLGNRDLFFMILLYDTGARLQEILNLKLKDIQIGKSPTVTLHGKGMKVRVVPIMPKTVKHFERYLAIYHSEQTSSNEEYLFYVIRNSVKSQMSPDNVRKFLQKYGTAAKQICSEVPDNIHPHLWRHSRAMHLYQHGMDLTLISQWLGHANLETTLIYAHADTELKRKAIEKSKQNQMPVSTSGKKYKLSDTELIKKLYGLA